ncbi:MAG: LemA family protein [Verrucomicrobiota bacterium]|nr:LemA family protein [Verrucomicrobiota bacterium]
MNVFILANIWVWAVPLAIALIFIFWAGGVYNALIRLRNFYENAWAQIDVQLERRYDLIPDLVETVKGIMKHERETLEEVIKARNSAVAAKAQNSANIGDPDSMGALIAAEAGLQGALGNLFALSESYPDLKANQNMLQLQEELTSTENKIAFARQAFNDSVTSYNNKRETFPSNIIAGMFGFKDKSLYEVKEEKKEKVAVKF